MVTRTKSGAEKNAATCTSSSRLNKSQQAQLRALQTNQWWPFNRADPKVLSVMHRSTVERGTRTIDAPEALF
jgi:hypothetical protein